MHDNEVCICAAVKAMDGYIARGHRHHNCFDVIDECRKRPDTRQQGFITSRGRFVDRHEGYELQIAAGIESVAKGGYRNKRLFSEDLY